MRWSVVVEAEGDRVMTREEIVELADAVAGHSGIASGIGSMGYGAQVIIEADTDAEAVDAAVALLAESAEKAGLPAWPATRAEATGEDDDGDVPG